MHRQPCFTMRVTLVIEMVCCSMASWMATWSLVSILSNSSMQQMPYSTKREREREREKEREKTKENRATASVLSGRYHNEDEGNEEDEKGGTSIPKSKGEKRAAEGPGASRATFASIPQKGGNTTYVVSKHQSACLDVEFIRVFILRRH
jgi:hypothetical protein